MRYLDWPSIGQLEVAPSWLEGLLASGWWLPEDEESILWVARMWLRVVGGDGSVAGGGERDPVVREQGQSLVPDNFI